MSPSLCGAYEVLLRWTVPPEPDVVGYYLYEGPGTGVYLQRTDVGKTGDFSDGALVYFVLRSLGQGTSYYLAVTAVSSGGVESPFSNEKRISFSSVSTPIADAGPDQAGIAGDVLTLGAAPVAGVSYFWQQTAGPPAALANPTSSLTTFQADYGGSYELTVTAYDSQGLAAQDSVRVVLTDPSPPTASPTSSPIRTPFPTATPSATSTSPPATPLATLPPMNGHMRLYLTALPPSFAPAQTAGQWTLAPAAQVLWSPTPGGPFGNVLRQEANGNTIDVGLLWGITEPLIAFTISSGAHVSWGIETAAQSEDADFYWHMHLTALAGDSDSVRCTLVDNYREDSSISLPWPDTPQGLGPAQAVPLADCATNPPQPGDRLAIEVGYVARNRFAESRFGFINYGTDGPGVAIGMAGGAPWVDLDGVELSFVGGALPTPTFSAAATPSMTPTRSPSRTATGTHTATRTATATAPMPTASGASATITATATRTSAPSYTATPTRTGTATFTQTRSATPTATSATPTATPRPEPLATPGETRVRLYLTSLAPSYAPAQARGSWYAPPASKVWLATTKAGVPTNALRVEATTTVSAMGLLWGISAPLSSINLPTGSRVDWGIEVAEQSIDADFFWKVHLYVLAGSTSTVRCTLLSNYEEGSASSNEWTVTPVVRSPQPEPPVLSSCGTSSPRPGDRIAIEIGYVARNRFSSSRFGFLNYGSTAADAVPGASGGAAWVDFIGASVTF